MGLFGRRKEKKAEPAPKAAPIAKEEPVVKVTPVETPDQLFEKGATIANAGDKAGSYEYFLKAAKQNHVPSIHVVIRFIVQGHAPNTTRQDSVPWLYRLQEIGHGEDELTFLRDPNTKAHPTVNELIEKDLNAKKAQQQEAEELYQKGRIHDAFSGMGVYKGGEPDNEKAFHWYKQAAEMGHLSAQNLVGLVYEMGLGIVSKDYDTAFRWYARAAFNPDFNERTADDDTIHSKKVAYDNLLNVLDKLSRPEVMLRGYLPEHADDILEEKKMRDMINGVVSQMDFKKMRKEAFEKDW